MSKIDSLERQVHGRARDLDNDDELHYGVLRHTLYAKNTPPVDGAQWTGIVTQVRHGVFPRGRQAGEGEAEGRCGVLQQVLFGKDAAGAVGEGRSRCCSGSAQQMLFREGAAGAVREEDTGHVASLHGGAPLRAADGRRHANASMRVYPQGQGRQAERHAAADSFSVVTCEHGSATWVGIATPYLTASCSATWAGVITPRLNASCSATWVGIVTPRLTTSCSCRAASARDNSFHHHCRGVRRAPTCRLFPLRSPASAAPPHMRYWRCCSPAWSAW
eukprot:365281-Chlamydomonas_euryale.AAC.4